MRASASTITISMLLVAGCGDVAAGTSGAEAKSSTATATASAAVAKASASATAAPGLPAEADPTVVTELKKFQACSIKEGFGFDFGCAAEEAFKTFADKYVAGEKGSDPAKVQKLGKTCLAVLGDADAKVRLAAAKCLQDGFDARVDASALDSLFAALESESNPTVRGRIASPIGTLAISEKHATRAAELIKKLKANPSDRPIVASLLEGLKRGSPNDAAIDEALLLAGDDDFATAGYALELLGQQKTRTADACKAVEAVVVGKKRRWAGAASTLVKIEPACTPDLERVVTAIAERLVEDDTETALYRSSKLIEVGRFVAKAKLDAAQKGMLTKAAAARHAKKLAGEETEIAALEKKLKK